MRSKKALQEHGFTVKKEGDGYFISRYTPAGEDWGFYLCKLTELESYIDCFDPEEEFNILWRAKQGGFQGVPEPAELWQDQLWKQRTLNRVKEDL